MPEPPASVLDEEERDRRLVRAMLAMDPDQRLESLRNWAQLSPRTSDPDRHEPSAE